MSNTSANLRVGELRHRLEIISPSIVQDSYGNPTVSLDSVFATVWGSLEGLTARELVAFQQTQDQCTHKVTIRYLANVTTKMNIRYEGKYYQITDVEDVDERKKKLVLLIIERSDGTKGRQ